MGYGRVPVIKVKRVVGSLTYLVVNNELSGKREQMFEALGLFFFFIDFP